MARTPTSETLWNHVYEQLRRDILNGLYPPGTPLKPSELRVKFDVSVSVMREALSHLVENRLVRAQHNKGFKVVELSEKDLQELTELRVLVEGFALRRSIEQGNSAWESSVVAAHHILSRTPMRAPGKTHGNEDAWPEAHRAFHRALVAACDMPLFLEMCSKLFDATELYRRLSEPAADEVNRDVAGEHKAICDAAVARDVDRAVAELTTHFKLTTELLARQLQLQSA